MPGVFSRRTVRYSSPLSASQMVSPCAGPTRGVCDRALHEHRRPSSLPSHVPSELACFLSLPQQSEGAGSFRLRTSSETLPIPYTFLRRSGQGCPRLRASNEHSFTVRVLRARRALAAPSPILLSPRIPWRIWDPLASRGL